MLCLSGCNTRLFVEEGTFEQDKFVFIEVDNSGTLNTTNSYSNYWYLKDTGVVYVGDCLDVISSRSWATPVISANGNYYTYNTETRSVEEVVK